MKEYKKVSVIITSFNQKNYLEEALESVLNQTVKPYEILIPDDCSSDGSVEMIREYEKKYPGVVKGVFNKKNQGIPKNRNSALRKVSGEYVYILDGDDKFLPNNIESMLNYMGKNPDVKSVYSNINFIDEAGKFICTRDKNEQPEGDILFEIALGKFGILRNMIVEYSMLKKIGFMDHKIPKYDGFDLTLRMADVSKIGYIFEPLAEYRVYPTSDSKGLKPIDHILDLEKIYRKIIPRLKKFTFRGKNKVRKKWRIRLLRFHTDDAILNNKKIKIVFLPLIITNKIYNPLWRFIK